MIVNHFMANYFLCESGLVGYDNSSMENEPN